MFSRVAYGGDVLCAYDKNLVEPCAFVKNLAKSLSRAFTGDFPGALMIDVDYRSLLKSLD